MLYVTHRWCEEADDALCSENDEIWGRQKRFGFGGELPALFFGFVVTSERNHTFFSSLVIESTMSDSEVSDFSDDEFSFEDVSFDDADEAPKKKKVFIQETN